MKKLITFFLILTIVFSFTACAASNALYSVDDVDALEKEVNAAWTARGHDSVYAFQYYGSCNGYHIVLFVAGPAEQAFQSKKVAGHEFEYHSSFFLKAYKDGDFIELKEAYESGFVTEEAIAKAVELHYEKWPPKIK